MIKREIPKRSYHGNKWKTNKTNKKHLAEDFKHRCAYCDDLDNLYAGENTYAVEHFAPKEKFPDLIYDYDNLLYVCSFCNGAKSCDWPSQDSNINIVDECGYVDPCDEEYYLHLDRDESTGKIIYKTKLGEYMYHHLGLDLKRHEILYMMNKFKDKLDEYNEKLSNIKANGDEISEEQKDFNECLNKFYEYYVIMTNQ